MKKQKKNVGEIYIDTDLNAYKGFFEREWAENIMSLTRNTKLETQVLNLCATWKGVSNARRLPWLMMYSLRVQQESNNDRYIIFPQQLLQLFIQRLGAILEKRYVSLSQRAQNVLCEELENFQDELMEDYKKSRSTLGIEHFEKLWMDFAHAPELAFGLWMSEINAFVSIYFAYETFFIEGLKLAYPNERIRVGKPLNDFFQRLNTTNLQKKYWDDAPIEKARLIRHAVTHNGRKVTGELGSKFKNDLLLTSHKEIVIKATNTTKLYHLLKKKVKDFSVELLKLPSMQ